MSIIIINYNQVQLTIDCIESLISSGADLSQIIIIDNASEDKSAEILNTYFGPTITIHELSENKGYPHGLNVGISIAVKKGADWFLLMNNDVIVDEIFLPELQKAINENPSAKLIGPAILYYDQPKIVWYLGYKIIPGTLIGVRSFRGRKYNEKIPKYVSIDVMHGCTMLVHKIVFDQIGLFDDSDIIYGDDADFSLRARNAGFLMIGASRAKIWHRISATMGKEKPQTRYLRTRNTIAFYNRYSKGISKYIMLIFTLLKTFVTLIKDIIMHREHLILPLCNGFIDGWRLQKDTLSKSK